MTTSFTHDNQHLAETYDRASDSQFEGGKRLLDRLALAKGASVLDVGCGTGRLALWIADIVGPTGAVMGTDPLPDRIAIARAKAPGIAFEVGQAEDLSAFADESFDAVCMSAVFHWVSDKMKALAEIRRVLRPGGRLGVTTLPRELSAAGTVGTVLVPMLQREPYVNQVDLSALAVASKGHTTTDLISMVIESHLELAELHVMPRVWTRFNGEELVDFLEASSFGNFLRIVPEGLRRSLRADLAAAFDARRGPGGITVRDWGVLFVATRA